MTDQPIGPMGGQELDNLRLTLDGMSERALLRSDGVITWWDAARLIARLDAEIAARKAAEAERDAALARALPAPVKMETLRDVEAISPGDYLAQRPGSGWRFATLRIGTSWFSPREWSLGGYTGVVPDVAFVDAWIAGPLPDLPIPTREEG